MMLRQIQHFQTIVQENSFTEAAELCHISQSGISRSIKALEDEMQLMESMEIIDPHMSEADFNKMKAKHRADEQKAIMKADMDYLKAIVKNNLDGGVKPYSDMGASTAVPAPALDMSL